MFYFGARLLPSSSSKLAPAFALIHASVSFCRLRNSHSEPLKITTTQLEHDPDMTHDTHCSATSQERLFFVNCYCIFSTILLPPITPDWHNIFVFSLYCFTSSSSLTILACLMIALPLNNKKLNPTTCRWVRLCWLWLYISTLVFLRQRSRLPVGFASVTNHDDVRPLCVG